ncbi:MAG: hypothetical protein VKJ44_01280 [Synechococcus sp.]|nr:hypothetical protein [Synechococcus sp.]
MNQPSASDRPSSGSLPPATAAGPARSASLPLLPLLLLLLALADLRTELLLLFDHFTVTSLLQAILSHPLAVVVLLAQPSLWRRYRGRRS